MDGDPYRTAGKPVAGPPRGCPRCGTQLEQNGTRWICTVGKCGEWLPPSALEAWLAIPEPGGPFAEILRMLAARAEPWPEAACPCCSAPMDTTMRARVVFDYCFGHGVWLDRGEREALDHARLAAGAFD